MYCMTTRLTISLPEEAVSFINSYRKTTGANSSSQVVQEALALLEKRNLYDMFTEMGKADEGKAVVELGKLAAEDFLDDTW